MHTVAEDGVASIKRHRRDLSSDGVKNLAIISGRGRLKEDLESSTWRRRDEERNNDNDVATGEDIEKPTRTEMGIPVNEVENRIKNDIEPIAPTMTVNRLVLEWEEKIKLHQEKEMDFNRWRNKNFKNERLAPVKIEDEVDYEGEVM
ncbi:hypothetical protein Tco_1245236 [Tanacetum coccineum]